MLRMLFVLTMCLSPAIPTIADETEKRLDSRVKLAASPDHIVTACGVTRQKTPIPVILQPTILRLGPQPNNPLRVLVLGGVDGEVSTKWAFELWNNFHRNDEYAEFHQHISLAVVPDLFPDNNSQRDSTHLAWPPSGKAYNTTVAPETVYIWRWIGNLAPDVVLVGNNSSSNGLEANFVLKGTVQPKTGLLAALAQNPPLQLGRINAVSVPLRSVDRPNAKQVFESLLTGHKKSSFRSAAHQELARRARRSPIEIAEKLAKVYGKDLPSVTYIPTLALIGRLRVAELTDKPSYRTSVEKTLAPFLQGTRKSMGKRVSGSHLSGHLIFSAMARRTKNEKYTELARAAADLGFEQDGRLKPSMPFHSEMSDAVFMGTPILVETGQLTGETKYFDMAFRHLRFMTRLNERKDGLHRHSPLDQTAWGRGNGFVALGHALGLSALPSDHPHRVGMLESYQKHIDAMIRHQDEMGMWHQVVDHPESYREFTVTCMTTFSIARGISRGWLDRNKYQPIVQKAWPSIAKRIGDDGVLIDVCTGTGKQKSFRDYLDRPAIFGRDARGGAMALMVTTELAATQLIKRSTEPTAD